MQHPGIEPGISGPVSCTDERFVHWNLRCAITLITRFNVQSQVAIEDSNSTSRLCLRACYPLTPNRILLSDLLNSSENFSHFYYAGIGNYIESALLVQILLCVTLLSYLPGMDSNHRPHPNAALPTELPDKRPFYVHKGCVGFCMGGS